MDAVAVTRRSDAPICIPIQPHRMYHVYHVEFQWRTRTTIKIVTIDKYQLCQVLRKRSVVMVKEKKKATVARDSETIYICVY